MRYFRSASAVALFTFACSSLAAEKVNYQEHILPIFRNACLNCHNPDKKKAGLDLSTYAGTLIGADSEKVVSPGDPDGSMLYKCVMHTEEPKMPQKADKLPGKELALIRQWIEQGALETANGKPAAASKPKVDLSVDASSIAKPTGPLPMPKTVPIKAVTHPRHPGPLNSLATSPWSPLVALGGQKQVLLYNTETLALLGILPFPEGNPDCVTFSRNGSMLLVAGGQGAKLGRAVLFDITSGKRVAELGEEYDEILAADISPDQTAIATGAPSRILKVYSTADGTLLQSVKKHTDWVTAVAYSPDGKYLASADRAGNLYVWEAKAIREVYHLEGHKGGITALSFRADSRLLASASEDGTIKLWEMGSGTLYKSINAHSGGVESVNFAQDGKIISCGRDKLTRLWKADGSSLKSFPAARDIALRCAITADGSKVISADFSGKIDCFNPSTGKLAGELSSLPPR